MGSPSLAIAVRAVAAVILHAMATVEPREAESENLSRDLSRAMVALFKEYVGRGPTHARAYVDDDLISIVLQDTMIKAEKTLADEGEEEPGEG